MCGILAIIQYANKKICLDSALASLNRLKPRGPDAVNYKIIKFNEEIEIFLGFTRLAIIDRSNHGVQPFSDADKHIVCNGEIYNHVQLRKDHNINTISNSDCAVLLPLIEKVGFVETIKNYIDAEFSMIYVDVVNQVITAATDRYGVRPLYYGYDKTSNTIVLSSELKAINNIEVVEQLKPNHMIEIKPDETFGLREYFSYDLLKIYPSDMTVEYIESTIRDTLTNAVKKRLVADRPIGFLLSGGLDSSLIVAIATKILGPDNIVCFSIGLEGNPDVAAAKIVTEFLGIKNHHIVTFTTNDGIDCLKDVIETIETYDTTTIRASIPQYLLAKYINENTDIKVILSGEGSDEVHGSYRYFRDAPDPNTFHTETIRLIEELYLFDNRRTDRTTAAHGLEVRVPFLDFAYVEFMTMINPRLKMHNRDIIEKKILRDSFVGYLPTEILYRSKEAFSDAVSSKEINWANSLIELAVDRQTVMRTDLVNAPKTIDAMMFTDIYMSIYPKRRNIIPHYWLPRFQKTEIVDPSARVLDCY